MWLTTRYLSGIFSNNLLETLFFWKCLYHCPPLKDCSSLTIYFSLFYLIRNRELDGPDEPSSSEPAGVAQAYQVSFVEARRMGSWITMDLYWAISYFNPHTSFAIASRSFSTQLSISHLPRIFPRCPKHQIAWQTKLSPKQNFNGCLVAHIVNDWSSCRCLVSAVLSAFALPLFLETVRGWTVCSLLRVWRLFFTRAFCRFTPSRPHREQNNLNCLLQFDAWYQTVSTQVSHQLFRVFVVSRQLQF